MGAAMNYLELTNYAVIAVGFNQRIKIDPLNWL